MNTAKAIDMGLLLMRLGVGIIFIIHGWGKLSGGTETWAKIGSNMEIFGLGFVPTFWGFMAAFSEAVGGLCLALGIFVRPFSLLMLITMTVATVVQVKIYKADFGPGVSHPLKMCFVFLGMIFTGGGKYTLQQLIPFLRDRWYI